MKNLTISKKIKLEILKILAKEEVRLFKNMEALDFFDSLLDLRLLPSQDSDYQDAKGDFIKNYQNNNNWDLSFILLDRFNFIDSDELFFKLLELVISPTVNATQDDIKYFYYTLNSILNKESLEFFVDELDENNNPVYRIGVIDLEKRFNDIPNNKYIINIKNKIQNSEEAYLELIPQLWDDYDCKNLFILKFYNKNKVEELGHIKIIDKNKSSTTQIIVESFKQLPSDFCSLGQNIGYYHRIKKIFGHEYLSILKALNDAALFTQIAEDFENTVNFKNSLIRYREQEQILRQARYVIDNYDLKNLYSFNYHFKPPFLDEGEGLDISFKFDATEILPNRIYALIGKNGSYKTQLVTRLPLDISEKKSDLFEPKIPLFSKVIAVSYSAFDKFSLPSPTSVFNYIYCGLRDNKSSEGKILTAEELLKRFEKSISRVEESKAFSSWVEIISSFFPQEVIDNWLENDKTTDQKKLLKAKFILDLEKFSSGQAIFVYILTEILANIRYDSLIIFDEPENHLHPNAISQLINSINILLKEFKSFCIIATHSPIIVQSILSKNVYVLRNEQEVLSATHPSLETFGENLSKITDDIFGARETTSYFKKELESLVDQGYNYEEIINLLQTHDVPLSLNATILLKNLVDNNV